MSTEQALRAALERARSDLLNLVSKLVMDCAGKNYSAQRDADALRGVNEIIARALAAAPSQPVEAGSVRLIGYIWPEVIERLLSNCSAHDAEIFPACTKGAVATIPIYTQNCLVPAVRAPRHETALGDVMPHPENKPISFPTAESQQRGKEAAEIESRILGKLRQDNPAAVSPMTRHGPEPIDLAGRPLSGLLQTAGEYMRQTGGGPLADCLLDMAQRVRHETDGGKG